jgi:hypothetical protein
MFTISAVFRNLLRVDARRRRRHIHLLAHNLLMRYHHFHAVLIGSDAALIGLIESSLLNGDPVRLTLPRSAYSQFPA